MTTPGSASRYEQKGKAAAYEARNPARTRAERALLSALLARGGQPSSVRVPSILDAPCGTGRLYPWLAQDLKGAHYLGLDGSLAMLEQAQAKDIPAAFIQGDLQHLPLAERSFDLVVSFRFLHHLAKPEAATALRQLARVTRRDLVLSAFHPWSAHHLSRKIQNWLQRRPLPRHAHSPRWIREQLAHQGLREIERARMGHFRDLWVGLYRKSPPGLLD